MGSIYLGARMLHSLFVAVLLVAVTAAFGRVLYHADIPRRPDPGQVCLGGLLFAVRFFSWEPKA